MTWAFPRQAGLSYLPFLHLVDLEGQSGASWESHQLLPKKSWVRVGVWLVSGTKGKPCSFASERLLRSQHHNSSGK